MAAIQQVLLARGASTPTGEASLLREDDFYVLREDDGRILLESAISGSSLLREDDFYVRREDDGLILLEGEAAPPPPSGDALIDTLGGTITDTLGDTITGL